MDDQNKDQEDQITTNEQPVETPSEFVSTDTKTEFGVIRTVNIVEEVEKSYLDYAMSVIVARALPDVRDGLKPVHRRILFSMHESGVTHKTPYKKSARIVGEVLGKYHPHGDQAVYDALVRLAQDFNMRYPLIDGQGNFGSVDGDPAAAMRYTEVRLEKVTQEMLQDIDKNTVDFTDNFDASMKEPTVMPAKLPNLLLMGSDGIAVGMATKIPPHNLREVVAAIVELVERGNSEIPDANKALLKDPETDDAKLLTGVFESETSLDDILKHIKGPDFPTGAEIFDKKAIREMYATGRGSIVVKAKAAIEEKKNGRFQIRVTELPYQVNKARLIAKIADLVRKKKLEGISDLRDESDRQGMSVVVEVKRDAVPKKVLNNLFKQTELQTTFPSNFVALDPELTPHVMNLRQILVEYIKHRQVVIVKRSQYDLKAAKARAHILEGLLKALDVIDQVIETIRKSPDSDSAKKNLISKFEFTDIQAQAILDMQLRKLAALERQKIQDEYNELMKKIDALVTLITSPKLILKEIRDEVTYLSKEYGDERRTKVNTNPVGEINEEDLIANEEVIVSLTQTGYIKRMARETFRSQRRGGKGVTGMTKKEQDELKLLVSANTHDNLLVFTNLGRVFKLKVYELPEGSRVSKGQAIVNLINTEQGELVQSILPMTEKLTNNDNYLFFTTKLGVVKRTELKSFQNIKSNGLIAIKLQKDDQLVWVYQTTGHDHILLVTKEGKSIRFAENDVRPTARDTMGVRGIVLKGADFVLGMEAFDPDKEAKDATKKIFRHLMIVTSNGYGKRSPLGDYPLQKRGGQGVKAAELNKKVGDLAVAQLVDQTTDEVVITTKQAIAIRLPLKNIPILKRPTQGVILMRFAKSSDHVVSATTLTKDSDKE
jgi:DNA gyrase subunit A